MKTLAETIQDMVMANNPKAIAEELGKPYSTFMREINPDDHGAKVGADTLIGLTRATGNFSAIDYIEHSLNRVAYRLPSRPVGHEALHAQLAKAMSEFGQLLDAMGDGLEDGTLSPDERARCATEGLELMAALARLVYMLKGKP